MKILFISNYSPFDSNGGAEKNSKALIEWVRKDNPQIEFEYCRVVDFDHNWATYSHYDLFIFESFDSLSNKTAKEIEGERYFIFENSYGFSSDKLFGLKQRSKPLIEENLCYESFYKNAEYVILQSSFQETIFRCNLGDLGNYIVLDGNFWEEKEIEMLDLAAEKRAFKEFKDPDFKRYLIIDGKTDLHRKIKGVDKAIDFCKENGWKFDLKSSFSSYQEYLNIMADYDDLVFFPTVPETFSRVYIEAKYLGLKVFSNNNIGAKSTKYENVHLPFKMKQYSRQDALRILILI